MQRLRQIHHATEVRPALGQVMAVVAVDELLRFIAPDDVDRVIRLGVPTQVSALGHVLPCSRDEQSHVAPFCW